MRETLAFVASRIGAGRRRILEIGAGDGELAAELTKRGHPVVAIDSSAEAVAAARGRGVDARVADWPDFEDGTFDALLFTRSLHHIEDLDTALERAAAALRPAGRVLIEDFAFPDLGPGTIRWFVVRLAELAAAGHLRHEPATFAWKLLDSADPVEAWREAAHHVHGAAELRRAVRDHFAVELEGTAPYLYRYLAGLVTEDELEEFLDFERASILAAEIEPLGLRLVTTLRYP